MCGMPSRCSPHTRTGHENVYGVRCELRPSQVKAKVRRERDIYNEARVRPDGFMDVAWGDGLC